MIDGEFWIAGAASLRSLIRPTQSIFNGLLKSKSIGWHSQNGWATQISQRRKLVATSIVTTSFWLELTPRLTPTARLTLCPN
jgi:hypothetical protein